jgi:2-polyprenyl-6-methoxyphenol hydroxylase-like FAD-dependent oxidoreductase
LSALIKTEIAVVGGGPAGSIAANVLSRLGRDVVLCEASEFARHHVGISLSPGVAKQLAFVGLDSVLDKPCHRRDIAIERRWGNQTFELSTGRVSTIVDRGILDSDLVAAARRANVKVLQPAMVREQKRAGNVWWLDVRGENSSFVIEANFVIEATGRHTRFRRRRRYGATTLAICGSWAGTAAAAVRISAQSNNWCWGAPTGPQKNSLLCFVDPQYFQTLKCSFRERYLRMAYQSGVLPGIEALTLVGKPYACDATPYVSEQEAAGILCVGDADLTLDPLSSGGVQAAIQSSLAIGPIVNTLLTQGADWDAAMEFWRTSRIRRMTQHREWSRRLHSEALGKYRTTFWDKRSGPVHQSGATGKASAPAPAPDQLIRLSEHTRFIPAPCLTDGLVEKMECVSHANLAEPLAFLGTIHLAAKLRQVNADPPVSARRLLEAWSTSMSPNGAFALLAWTWRNGLIVDASQGDDTARTRSG